MTATTRRADTGKPGNAGKYDAKRRAEAQAALLGGQAVGIFQYMSAPDSQVEDLYVPEILPNVSTQDEAAAFTASIADVNERFDEAFSLASTHGADGVSHAQERLAREAGALVATRAETLAGITDEQIQASHAERLADSLAEFDAATAQNQRLLDAFMSGAGTQAEFDEFLPNYIAARAAHQAVKNAQDPQTKADLARLSQAYTQALAEVRDMGGELSLDASSQKAAVAVFNEAAQVFPSEWLDQANKHAGPVAKLTTSRAHYSHLAVQQTKKKELSTTRYVLTGDMPSDTAFATYRVLDETTEDGQPIVEGVHHEVVRTYGSFDAQRPPKGRGWEACEYVAQRSDGTKTTEQAWHRPRHRMKVAETKIAPEIRTNKASPDEVLPGQSLGFAVAVHESTHRMEYTVRDVERLEAAFFERRTTLADGTRAPLERIHPRSKELVREGGFPHRYIGKDYRAMGRGRATKVGSEYGDRHVVAHEVMSVGMDSLMGGRQGALIGVGSYEADADYRYFVLGVLATAGRKTDPRFDDVRRRFAIA
jgi:hypothetical protein